MGFVYHIRLYLKYFLIINYETQTLLLNVAIVSNTDIRRTCIGKVPNSKNIY